MARKEFLDYVWKYCIEPQLGYSFSINHTLPYSLVAVQEANLATRWNPLYWQCACLCVNAGNYADALEDEEEGAEESSDEDTEEKKGRKVAPNYGKIARAIYNAQSSGVTVDLPDINTAQTDFVPDIEHNTILYSLQAITAVGDDLLEKILQNRPFSSVEDFIQKINPTTVQMIGLLKAGCFDALEKKNRRVLIAQYLQSLAEENFPEKDKLTATQLKKMIDGRVDFGGHNIQVRLFNYKRYIDANQNDKPNKRYILTEEKCLQFFNANIKAKLDLNKNEYGFLPGDKVFIKQSAFKKVYDKEMASLMEYINTQEGKDKYLTLVREEFIKNLTDKYCQGSESSWEMETMSFYHSGHELSKMNDAEYGVVDFNTLPEIPGDSKQYCGIAGTVIETNNTRHTVSLLTKYGVVDVKFYSQTYIKYNQNISVLDPETKKKKVVENSWFKRGSKVLLFGFRRENMFCCRKMKIGNAYREVGLIEGVNGDGTLNLKFTRRQK